MILYSYTDFVMSYVTNYSKPCQQTSLEDHSGKDITCMPYEVVFVSAGTFFLHLWEH